MFLRIIFPLQIQNPGVGELFSDTVTDPGFGKFVPDNDTIPTVVVRQYVGCR